MTLPTPLFAAQAHLGAHFKRVEDILVAAVDVGANVQLDVDWASSSVVAGLVGGGCEIVPRNRGPRVRVAPLLHLQHGLWSWFGYREEWDDERSSGSVRRFSFRSAGLTIHFGWKNDLFKPQMFRAEWAGWAKWASIDYSFQADGAGHPHWQFDALDSLAAEDIGERAKILRAMLMDDAASEIRDFSPQLASEDVRDIVTIQKLSRIHFASAAAWWKLAPHDAHTHGPSSATDIENWIRRSLAYLNNELQRLQR